MEDIKMKKGLTKTMVKTTSAQPNGRPEVSDASNWYALALKNDLEIDDDIYTLLQALNNEVL